MCRPTKSSTPASITQGFHSGHLAVDIAGKYGEFLVAPWNCVVANVRGPQTLNNSPDDLSQGCGVKLQSIEDPSISFSYWHTLPIFNVKKGDIVLQGKVVAQMGNTGYVMASGKYVEIDIRLIPPFPGTHTHITTGRTEVDGTYTPMDYSQQIDWSIPVNYSVLETIQAFLQSISNIFKK